MAGSLLEAHKLVPTALEGQLFEPCDYYSLTERYRMPGGRSRKGRSKREAAGNTNRPSPAGHERKVALKLQRAEHRRGRD